MHSLNEHLDELARANKWDEIADTLRKESRGNSIKVKTVKVKTAHKHGWPLIHCRLRGKYCARRIKTSAYVTTLWKHYPAFPMHEIAYNACVREGVRYLIYVFNDKTFVADFRNFPRDGLILADIYHENQPELWLPKGRFELVSERKESDEFSDPLSEAYEVEPVVEPKQLTLAI